MVASFSTLESNVFIYPTDTVWGIGACIFEKEAQKLVRKIKGNHDDKPLSVLFSKLDEVLRCFDLSGDFETDQLRRLFQLETTLLIPARKMTGQRVPEWVYLDGPYVGVRCLENAWTQQLVERAKGPLTSTSLNLASHPPIVSYAEAKKFHQKYCPQAVMFEGPNRLSLSGHSSTILQLLESEIKVMREGNQLAQIKCLLGL